MSGYSALSLVFWLIFTGSSLLMVRGWKKTALFRPGAILWGQAGAFAAQFFYGAVAGSSGDVQQFLLLLVPGLAGGVIWGKFAGIKQTARGIALNYARPGVLIWTALMSVTQLSTILTGAMPEGLFGLSALSLGVNLGLNGKVYLNWRRIAGQAAGMTGV